MATVINPNVSTSDAGGGGGSAYSSGTGSLVYTPSNFKSGSKDLADIVRLVDDYNNISITDSSIFKTLESYKLSSNTIDYIVNTASTSGGGYAWGNETVSTNYRYGSDDLIPFVSKASTPCIKTSSYAPGYVYCAKLEVGNNYWLRYVQPTSTEECKIQYSIVSSTPSWTTVSTGAHGVFLLLQGAGGAGGSGDFEGVVFANGRNQGGAGGGGGGCVLAYINLKKYYENCSDSDPYAYISIGVGGSYNSSKKTPGSYGGSTSVTIGDSIDNYHKIVATGGRGGDCGSYGRGTRVDATGGSGGYSSESGAGNLFSNPINRCMHIVATCDGEKGGDSGYVSQTGNNSSNGDASTSVDSLAPKYFNGSIAKSYYQVGSYCYGKGTYALKYGSDPTESGGGGGGASFCGGAILSVSSDQASRIGYGMGGQGARTNREKIACAGTAGQNGVCYILKNYI